MTEHQLSPILPCNNIDATQTFYERLGFAVTAGDEGFRIMADGRGWQIALRPAERGWVIPDRNSHGLFLYCEDVDAIADKVRDIMRKSIAETERLVGESDEMLRRHRQECEDDDVQSDN